MCSSSLTIFIAVHEPYGVRDSPSERKLSAPGDRRAIVGRTVIEVRSVYVEGRSVGSRNEHSSFDREYMYPMS